MPYIAVDHRDRFQNGVAGRKQAAHGTRQTCNPATAVDDLAREGRTEPARQPHPEHDRQAADLILENELRAAWRDWPPAVTCIEWAGRKRYQVPSHGDIAGRSPRSS